MKRNFEDVCRTDDFLELSVDDVEELISCDNIYVQSEETVVEAVSLWLEAREDRADYRARLMTHVKLSNLSPDSLSSLVSRNLVTSGQQQSLEAEAVDVKSRSRGLNKFIVAMAFDSNAVEYLDLDRYRCKKGNLVLSLNRRIDEGWNILTECPNMRYGLSGAGLVSLGDTLLLTGGVGRAGILKAINRFPSSSLCS